METETLWSLYAFVRVIFFIFVAADIIVGIGVATCEDKEKVKSRQEFLMGLLKATGIAFLIMGVLLLLYEQSFVGLQEHMNNQ